MPLLTSLSILEFDCFAPEHPGTGSHLGQEVRVTEAQAAAPAPEDQLQFLVFLDELHQPPKLLILLCQPLDLLPQALIAAEEGHAQQQGTQQAGGWQLARDSRLCHCEVSSWPTLDILQLQGQPPRLPKAELGSLLTSSPEPLITSSAQPCLRLLAPSRKTLLENGSFFVPVRPGCVTRGGVWIQVLPPTHPHGCSLATGHSLLGSMPI